ncbi:MAG: VWA domain-containing protein, partial [Bacteroidota bacterium]
KNKTTLAKQSKASLVMMGFGDTQVKEEEEARNVSGANKQEALRKTDFSKINAIDSQLLDELADKLLQQMNHRLKRRMKSSKQGKIDIRHTIRKNIHSGGTFFNLERKNRRVEKYKLIVLLDVSGSMDKYSFFLLKFIWSLKSNFKDIEAFIFSTKLVRITDYLDKSQLEHTLHLMGQNTDNWSSGTNIGACLFDFNEQYARRALNGKSMTIILSDGLDTGEPEVLSEQLHKIKMRTNKLVWLNPLKGMEGYQPLAKGMKAALPEINTFESAHNLDSLLKLEKILAYV